MSSPAFLKRGLRDNNCIAVPTTLQTHSFNQVEVVALSADLFEMLFAPITSLALLAGAAESRLSPGAIALTPDALPVIDPPIDFDKVIESGLQENLPTTHYSIDIFSEGEIPEDCKREAELRNYTASDFEVFKVLYKDCDQPVSTEAVFPFPNLS